MLTKEILDQDYRRLTHHSRLVSQMMSNQAHEFFLTWLKTQSGPFLEWSSAEGYRIHSMRRGETAGKILPGSLPDGFVFTFEPDNVLIEEFAEYKIASSNYAESMRRQVAGVKKLHETLYAQNQPDSLVSDFINTEGLPLSVAHIDQFTFYYEFPKGGLRILALLPEIKETNLEVNSLPMTVTEIKVGLNGILADIQHFSLREVKNEKRI